VPFHLIDKLLRSTELFEIGKLGLKLGCVVYFFPVVEILFAGRFSFSRSLEVASSGGWLGGSGIFERRFILPFADQSHPWRD